jgi:hypothetical protein
MHRAAAAPVGSEHCRDSILKYMLLHCLFKQVSGTQHVAFTPEQVADGTVAQTFAEAYGYLELQVQCT